MAEPKLMSAASELINGRPKQTSNGADGGVKLRQSDRHKNSESLVVDKYGRLCYLNHNAKQTTWLPPPELWRCQFGLPYGWELAYSKEEKFYFISHVNGLTTFFCPDVDGSQSNDVLLAFEEKKRCVNIHKSPAEGFGFVAGSERPVLVRSVIPNGASEGKLFANDQIISINKQYVYNLPQPEVINMIKTSPDTLEIEVIATEDVLDARGQGHLKSAIMSRTRRERRRSFPVSVRFIEDPVVVDIADAGGDPIKQMLPNVVKIVLENGQTKSFQYGDDTTVKDLFGVMVEKLKFESECYLSLVLVGPFVNQKTYLRDEDKVSQIINKKQFSRWECRLQVCFIPANLQELHDKSPLIFDYLYEQTCQSVVHGHLGAELKYDMALRLAALQIHENVSRMANPGEFKMTVKEIEAAYSGLEEFVPKSVLLSTRKKDLRRSLGYYMKMCMKLTSPGQKFINGNQAKLHYLKTASETSQFGGKAFNAVLIHCVGKDETIPDRRSEQVTIFINSRQGIVKSVTGIGSDVVQIANFDDVNGVVVTNHTLGKHHLKVFINNSKPLSLLLEPCDASDLVFLLSGYAKINCSADGNYFLPFYDLSQSAATLPDLLQLDTNDEKVPPFKGLHNVIPSTWSYKSRWDEVLACDMPRPTLDDIGIPIDIRSRLLSYEEARKRLNTLRKVNGESFKSPDKLVGVMNKRKRIDDSRNTVSVSSPVVDEDTYNAIMPQSDYRKPRRYTAPGPPVDFSNSSLKLQPLKDLSNKHGNQLTSSFSAQPVKESTSNGDQDYKSSDFDNLMIDNEACDHQDGAAVFSNSAFVSDSPRSMYYDKNDAPIKNLGEQDKQAVRSLIKEDKQPMKNLGEQDKQQSFQELIYKHPLSLKRSNDSNASWVCFDGDERRSTFEDSGSLTKDDSSSLSSYGTEVWPDAPDLANGAPLNDAVTSSIVSGSVLPSPLRTTKLLGPKRGSDPFVNVDPFADIATTRQSVQIDERSFNNNGIESIQWQGSLNDLDNTFHHQHDAVDEFRLPPPYSSDGIKTMKEITVDENLNSICCYDDVVMATPDSFDNFDQTTAEMIDSTAIQSSFELIIPPPPPENNATESNDRSFSPSDWICPPPPDDNEHTFSQENTDSISIQQDVNDKKNYPIRPNRKKDAFRRRGLTNDLSFSDMSDIDDLITPASPSDSENEKHKERPQVENKESVVICRYTEVPDPTHSTKDSHNQIISPADEKKSNGKGRTISRITSDRRVPVYASFKDLPTKQRSNSLTASTIEGNLSNPPSTNADDIISSGILKERPVSTQQSLALELLSDSKQSKDNNIDIHLSAHERHGHQCNDNQTVVTTPHSHVRHGKQSDVRTAVSDELSREWHQNNMRVEGLQRYHSTPTDDVAKSRFDIENSPKASYSGVQKESSLTQISIISELKLSTTDTHLATSDQQNTATSNEPITNQSPAKQNPIKEQATAYNDSSLNNIFKIGQLKTKEVSKNYMATSYQQNIVTSNKPITNQSPVKQSPIKEQLTAYNHSSVNNVSKAGQLRTKEISKNYMATSDQQNIVTSNKPITNQSPVKQSLFNEQSTTYNDSSVYNVSKAGQLRTKEISSNYMVTSDQQNTATSNKPITNQSPVKQSPIKEQPTAYNDSSVNNIFKTGQSKTKEISKNYMVTSDQQNTATSNKPITNQSPVKQSPFNEQPTTYNDSSVYNISKAGQLRTKEISSNYMVTSDQQNTVTSDKPITNQSPVKQSPFNEQPTTYNDSSVYNVSKAGQLRTKEISSNYMVTSDQQNTVTSNEPITNQSPVKQSPIKEQPSTYNNSSANDIFKTGHFKTIAIPVNALVSTHHGDIPGPDKSVRKLSVCQQVLLNQQLAYSAHAGIDKTVQEEKFEITTVPEKYAFDDYQMDALLSTVSNSSPNQTVHPHSSVLRHSHPIKVTSQEEKENPQMMTALNIVENADRTTIDSLHLNSKVNMVEEERFDMVTIKEKEIAFVSMIKPQESELSPSINQLRQCGDKKYDRNRMRQMQNARRSWFLSKDESSESDATASHSLCQHQPLSFDQPIFYGQADLWKPDVHRSAEKKDSEPKAAARDNMVIVKHRPPMVSYATSSSAPLVHRASLVKTPEMSDDDLIDEVMQQQHQQPTSITVCGRDPVSITTPNDSSKQSSFVKVTVTSRQWASPIIHDSVNTPLDGNKRQRHTRSNFTHQRSKPRRSKSDASINTTSLDDDYVTSLRRKSNAFYSRRGKHYAVIRTGSEESSDDATMHASPRQRHPAFSSQPFGLNNSNVGNTARFLSTANDLQRLRFDDSDDSVKKDSRKKLCQSSSFVDGSSFRYQLSHVEEMDCIEICRSNRHIAKNLVRQLSRHLEGRAHQSDYDPTDEDANQKTLIKSIRRQIRFLAVDLKVLSPPIAYIKLKSSLRTSINCIEKIALNALCVYTLNLCNNENDARQLLATACGAVADYRNVVGVLCKSLQLTIDESNGTDLLESNNDLASSLHTLLKVLRLYS